MKAPTTLLLLGLCAAVLFAPMAATAQSAHAYNLPAQSLSESLRELGTQAGVNVVFDASVIANRRAPVLRGNYDLKRALALLLKGSGFMAVFIDANTVVIKPIAQASQASPSTASQESTVAANAKTLDAVNVKGVAQALTAARSATPLNEAPQSVSILSQETFNQQNATDLASALQQATGIALVQNNSQQTYFHFRGFQIDLIHIDGAAPLSIVQGSVDDTDTDLAEIDNIEVLRGSGALFGGMGNPGVTVSLTQ